MRRPGSSPVKTEGERPSVGQCPPKSVDVKTEWTQDDREEYSTVDRPSLLGESSLLKTIAEQKPREVPVGSLMVLLCFSPGLERMKTELREEVSGDSSVSDVESDSDSPTEVSDEQEFIDPTL